MQQETGCEDENDSPGVAAPPCPEGHRAEVLQPPQEAAEPSTVLLSRLPLLWEDVLHTD